MVERGEQCEQGPPSGQEDMSGSPGWHEGCVCLRLQIQLFVVQCTRQEFDIVCLGEKNVTPKDLLHHNVPIIDIQQMLCTICTQGKD